MSSAQPLSGRPVADTAGAGPGHRRLGLALVVIATAQLMVVLDATIVNVALPHIQQALGFSGSGLEWVVNAYALTFGGLLLLGGRAGDILGRRRVLIAGIILFSAALAAGRIRHLGGLAAGRTRTPGSRRSHRRPGRAVPDRDHVPGGPAAQQGHGCLRRDEHRRRGGRPDRRRPAHHLRLLAVGVLRQRPDRDRRRPDGAARARGVRAAPRPVRPARRDHRHAGPRRSGVRPYQRCHQPQRCRALA